MELDLPSSPILVRLFAESPLLCSVPLVCTTLLSLWYAWSSSQWKPIFIAVAGLLATAFIVTVTTINVSPGEHAAQIVRDLARFAETADVVRLDKLFAPDARLHYGSLESASDDIQSILRNSQWLEQIHQIEANTIVSLDFATVDRESGIVILGCRTTVDSNSQMIPTRWWIRVRLTPENSWRIDRIVWTELFLHPPVRGVISHRP